MTEVQSGELSKDERTWGMLCHLSAFAGFFTLGIGSIVGPLAIWLIKKEEMPFVDDQGKEALNFQITVMIAALVCGLLMLVLIGVLLMLVLAVYNIVMIIIASMKANEGEPYRYPISLRLIK